MGRIILFFGCQYKSMDLYKSDKLEMINEGVLSKTYLALSREPSMQKVSWNLRAKIKLTNVKTNRTKSN